MWIFPNLTQNVDKIPHSKGPGPRAPYQKWLWRPWTLIPTLVILAQDRELLR